MTDYQFGDWRVEPTRNCVRRDGEENSLEPLAMNVLSHLLSAPNTVVSSDELLDQFWTNRNAEPGMVARCIAQIRSALGDSATNPTYIETIRKRGYRLVAPVSLVPSSAEQNCGIDSSKPSREPPLPRKRLGFPESNKSIIALAGLAIGAWFLLRSTTLELAPLAKQPTAPVETKSSPGLRDQAFDASATSNTIVENPLIRAELRLAGWEDWKTAWSPVPSMIISPDGKNLVYVARNSSGISSLKRRRLDNLDSIDLPGTAKAAQPFFSPDGKWVGYFDGDLMKRVALAGGEPSLIASAADVYGASWGADNRIYYSAGRAGLVSISVSEGDYRVETKLDVNRGEGSHRLPHYLPGHGLLLFSIFIDDSRGIKHETWVLDLKSGDHHYLFEGLAPTFVASGHIVYAKADTGVGRAQEVPSGSLWAVPFDPVAIELTGPPQLIQNAIAGREGSAYAVSRSGVLAYLPKQGDTIGELVLLDASGPTVLFSGPSFEHPQFSNDGKSIAVSVIEEGKLPAIWVYDIDSNSKRKIADNARFPLWDGDQRLTFMKVGTGLIRQSLSNPAVIETLVSHEQFIVPDAWVKQEVEQEVEQEDALLYHGVYPDRGILAYTTEANEGSQQRFAQRAAFPNLSASKQWVVFCTWPNGIQVGSFPELSSITTLVDSGCTPHWGHDDTRIYFQDFNKLRAVGVEMNDEQRPVFGTSEIVADLGYPGISLFDIDHRGRIIFARHTDTAPKLPVLLMNWQSTLN